MGGCRNTQYSTRRSLVHDRHRDRSRACTTRYGVIRVDGAVPFRSATGVSNTGRDRPAERLLAIYTGLQSLFDRYPPDALAMEKLFFSRNITSAMGVSEVRGIVLLAAEQRQIPVTEYTPNQIKQAVTGSGPCGQSPGATDDYPAPPP